MTKINLKRIYDLPSADDGFRVFIDRLWPRGMAKDQVKYDQWCKDVAPSAELRKWFHTDPIDNRDEFERRYLQELLSNPELESFVNLIKSYPVVTLLTATKNVDESYLSVLKRLLEDHESGFTG